MCKFNLDLINFHFEKWKDFSEFHLEAILYTKRQRMDRSILPFDFNLCSRMQCTVHNVPYADTEDEHISRAVLWRLWLYRLMQKSNKHSKCKVTLPLPYTHIHFYLEPHLLSFAQSISLNWKSLKMREKIHFFPLIYCLLFVRTALFERIVINLKCFFYPSIPQSNSNSGPIFCNTNSPMLSILSPHTITMSNEFYMFFIYVIETEAKR